MLRFAVAVALAVLLLGVCVASADVASSPASQSEFPVGTEFKTIDVATPKGKLMSESAMKKLLKPFISWGFEKLGEPYQRYGRWYQDLIRYSTKRGPKLPPTGGGAGIYWPFKWMRVGTGPLDGCWVQTTDGRWAPTLNAPPRAGETDWCKLGGFK